MPGVHQSLEQLTSSPVSKFSLKTFGLGSTFPCWASLMAQLVKNQPAMQETRVWSLVWESLPTPVCWPGEFGVAKSWTRLSDFHFRFSFHVILMISPESGHRFSSTVQSKPFFIHFQIILTSMPWDFLVQGVGVCVCVCVWVRKCSVTSDSLWLHGQ